MNSSKFHQKYSSARPPLSPSVSRGSTPAFNERSRGCSGLATSGDEQGATMACPESPDLGRQELRSPSRSCTPREDRVGVIGQYRKPWIPRPQSTDGTIPSLNERRRQMERYRSGDRPRSSPVARRHRSPVATRDRSVYGYKMMGAPGNGRPGSSRPESRLVSRSTSSMSRRRNSVVDSDVDEINIEKVPLRQQSKSSIEHMKNERESLEDILTNGWTKETSVSEQKKDDQPGQIPSPQDETEHKRIPTLSAKPRMHATVIEKDETSDNASDNQPTETKIIEPLIEPDDHDDEKANDEDSKPRKASIFDVTMMAAVAPGGLQVDRPRSSSNSSSAGRSTSSSTVSGEGLVRRARRERIKRLIQYKNTRFDRPAETPKAKLLRVCKTIKIVAGICLALKSYVKNEETKQWSLHEMHLNLRADMEQSLAFDLVMFSKLRVTRGSEKLKSILTMRPEDRTRANIEVILALLRKNKAFSEYQKETQIAFVKYMEYLRFEPRRIVLKEGHVASGFYIILSGTCLVNQKEVDPRNGETFVRTITQLSGGESFGEYSLLHNTVRSASVVCKDEVEVLLINGDDFDNIVKRPLEQKRDELIDFCHSHDIYISATEETLRDQPKAIYMKFFKPGTLITDDIMSSEYIYVVKEGKCNVVAEIKEMKPLPRKGKLPERFFMNDETWKKDAAIKRSMAVLGSAGGKRRSWSAVARKKLYPPEKKEKTFFSMNAINVVDSTKEYLADRRKSVQMAFKEEPQYLLQDDKFKTKKETQKPAEKDDKSAVIRTWKRVTVSANALSQKEEKKNPIDYAPQSKVKTTFAQLATLKKGMAFGIESLLPGTQPDAKLSLVSEGAEVILVSKRIFASDVTSTTLKTASKMAVDYPTVEFTREVLEEARTWASYKSGVIKEIYSKKLDKRPVSKKICGGDSSDKKLNKRPVSKRR